MHPIPNKIKVKPRIPINKINFWNLEEVDSLCTVFISKKPKISELIEVPIEEAIEP